MDQLKVWYYRAGSAGPGCPGRTSLPSGLPTPGCCTSPASPRLVAVAAEAAQYALDVAREAGVMVSFDLNYRAALWSADEARDVFRNFIAQADIVFAGDDEAAIAVGKSDDSLELARRVAALGPGQAVIKRGAAGCAAVIDGVEYVQDAVQVNAIDTVGAGDAFVAGYISDLLAGASVQERLLTAVRTGAFACLVPGDWEGHAAPARAGHAGRHGTGGALSGVSY